MWATCRVPIVLYLFNLRGLIRLLGQRFRSITPRRAFMENYLLLPLVKRTAGKLKHLTMKPIKESDKVSLTECRKILNKDGLQYTDADILAIRDFLYLFAEITYGIAENKSPEEIKIYNAQFNKGNNNNEARL